MRETNTDTGTTGTVTSGSSTILEDSSADFFREDIAPGSTVKNTTDGSEGEIKVGGIEETKITLKSALTGGANNTFTAADSYEISFTGTINSIISSTIVCKLCGFDCPKKELTKGYCNDCITYLKDDEDLLNG